MTPGRIAMLAALAVLAVGALVPSIAAADPPCGRGWRKGEWCGPGRGRHRDWRHHRHGRRGPPPGYYRRGYGYPPPPPVEPPGGIGIFIPFR